MKALPLVLLVALSGPALAADATNAPSKDIPASKGFILDDANRSGTGPGKYPDPCDCLRGTPIYPKSSASQQGRTEDPYGASSPLPPRPLITPFTPPEPAPEKPLGTG